MHHPVLPEITVDLVIDADAKTGFYHGIGCVNVHSGKLGVGSNVAAGENTGIVYVLSRIGLDVGFYSKASMGTDVSFASGCPGGIRATMGSFRSKIQLWSPSRSLIRQKSAW